jgi:hypothetical protein
MTKEMKMVGSVESNKGSKYYMKIDFVLFYLFFRDNERYFLTMKNNIIF